MAAFAGRSLADRGQFVCYFALCSDRTPYRRGSACPRARDEQRRTAIASLAGTSQSAEPAYGAQRAVAAVVAIPPGASRSVVAAGWLLAGEGTRGSSADGRGR